MGRTEAQHAGQSVRLRTLAAFLLALLFGLQAAPLVQAQSATAPDCCMAAEGKGCSMHLHRAMQAQAAGHTVAALQPRCPCPPTAPASIAAHDSLSLSASHLLFQLAAQRAVHVQLRSLLGVRAMDSGGTRGPPAVTLFA